ncbi:MAG: IS21-like element helper ATPase IstB [Patescibacteria group bacterium]|nr:IS21-like element helper ATPase IstB [Patescibacteria group bacterium]
MKNINEIKEKLRSLRLHQMSLELEQILNESTKKNASHLTFLERLVDMETDNRHQRSIEYRIKKAKLPELVTIDQFDFNYHKTRTQNKQRILNLLDRSFLESKTDIIFMGQPGVGKSFLAECVGLDCCKSNCNVLYVKTMDMINQLIASEADRTLHKKLDYYRKAQLLVLDELGYLSLNQQGSDLLFQVISGRHSVNSTIITTNRTFKDWGEIFYNTTVASAVADRLAANSEVILLERSYRPELNRIKKNKKTK